MIVIDTDKLGLLISGSGIPQTKLAGESGVSRATIAKLLSGKADRVHMRTADRLARALGVTTESIQKDSIRSAYLERVAKQNQYLDFTGLGIVRTDRPMPLEDGFVPIGLELSRSAMTRDETDRTGQCSDMALPHMLPAETGLPIGVPLPVALQRSKRLFLLGDPGTGKTTILRYTARCLAADRNADEFKSLAGFIPVYIRLGEWAEQLRDDDGLKLLDAAVAQATTGKAPMPDGEAEDMVIWLGEQSRAGHLLVLLDGLDEASDPELQPNLVEKIREFVVDNRGAYICLSARPVGFDRPNLGADFDEYKPQRLTDDAKRRFVEQWCAFSHEHSSKRECGQCAERVQELTGAIIDHRRIKSLSCNPMMLTILCLLHEARVRLPQRRFELYAKIVEALLFVWEQNKRRGTGTALERAIDLDERDVQGVLENIALEMQRKDWTLVRRWWLIEQMARFLREELGYENDAASGTAESLLRMLQHRAATIHITT
ncbi:MAG: helix-turn-helix domain-containing protein [Planctomycetes bacterium]|nr:helix-turn-helix domain-containing protein [Planctomycetota bacterium]